MAVVILFQKKIKIEKTKFICYNFVQNREGLKMAKLKLNLPTGAAVEKPVVTCFNVDNKSYCSKIILCKVLLL